MKQVQRRELNHRSGAILDEVATTKEPVLVTSRDGKDVIIRPAPQDKYERMIALGQLLPPRSQGSLVQIEPATYEGDTLKSLREMRDDERY